MLKTLARVGGGLVAATAVAAATRAAVQATTRRRVRATLPPGGISAVQPITLGGAEQWLLIQGHDLSGPAGAPRRAGHARA